jgi:hypothetical protein
MEAREEHEGNEAADSSGHPFRHAVGVAANPRLSGDGQGENSGTSEPQFPHAQFDAIETFNQYDGILTKSGRQ